MLFKNINTVRYKHLLWPGLTLIIFIGLLFFIINNINTVAKSDQLIFSYTVKVRNAVEEIDKVFERAEVNVNVMVDSIANSYDVNKQTDKAYNLHFINE